MKAYNEYEYSGKKVNVKDMSYSDYLDYWVDNYAKLNLRYSTIMSYCNIIKNHIKPRIGHYHKSYHFFIEMFNVFKFLHYVVKHNFNKNRV